MKGRREFRCRRCGYGIVAVGPPSDGCPMCHSARWVATGNRTMQDDRSSRIPLPAILHETRLTVGSRDLERVP